MISKRDIGKLDICPINPLRNVLGISGGDFDYLCCNGYVNGCIVDDTYWRLDEDGNWPEAI